LLLLFEVFFNFLRYKNHISAFKVCLYRTQPRARQRLGGVELIKTN